METISIEFTREEPRIGDRCVFWDDHESGYSVGVLTDVDFELTYPYEKDDNDLWIYCAKIKREADS